MTLEEQINKKINELLSEFTRCKSKKVYYKLVNTLVILKEIIDKANLDIIFPTELAYEITKANLSGNYENINDQ